MELIFDFIGAVLRFLFYLLINKISRKEHIPFSSFFGEKNSSKDMNINASNTITGLLFLIVILILIYQLTT